jgi:hypothetical protein
VTSLSARGGEAASLFVGDSNGMLHGFAPPTPPRPHVMFELAFPSMQIHTLSISHVLMVPKENVAVTLSYDCSVQVSETRACRLLCLPVYFLL